MKQFLFTLFLFFGIWVAYAGGNGNVIQQQEKMSLAVSPKTEVYPNAPVAYMISVGLASVAIILLISMFMTVYSPAIFIAYLALALTGGIFYLIGNEKKKKFYPERYERKALRTWKIIGTVLNIFSCSILCLILGALYILSLSDPMTVRDLTENAIKKQKQSKEEIQKETTNNKTQQFAQEQYQKIEAEKNKQQETFIQQQKQENETNTKQTIDEIMRMEKAKRNKKE